MASTVTLNVPDVAYIISHNTHFIIAAVAIVGASIVASILFQLYKTRKEFKDAEKLAKRAVALALTGFDTLTVTASYFLVIFDGNKDLATQLPWLAVLIPAAHGISRFLYDLGLNKTYKRVADVLGKWANKKPATDVQANVPVPVQAAPVTEDPLS
jgi:hypothetical protein